MDSRQTLEDAWNRLHQRQMKVYLGRCSMPSSYKRASKRDSRKSSASPPVFSFFLRIFSPPFYGCCDGALSENLQRQVLLLLFALLFTATLLLVVLICVLLAYRARNSSEGRLLKVVSCDRQQCYSIALLVDLRGLIGYSWFNHTSWYSIELAF